MTHNQKNQREKNNLILISNQSDRFSDIDIPNYIGRNSSFGSQFGGLFHNGSIRQASNSNNLFQIFKKDQKQKQYKQIKQQPIKIEQPLTQSQRYAQQCLQYEKYHFDSRIKLIIHRMAIKAYQNHKDKNNNIFLTHSIQKLLSIIAKKLLLNRFQLLFLEYVIQQTKWKYQQETVVKHVNQFNSYSQLAENQDQNQAIKNNSLKKLQIYLLFCSYYSKKSLNQFPGQNIFNLYLKSLCNKFKEYFNQWTQSSNVSNIKINPKILNNIFKRITFYNGRDNEQIQNYCLLVQEIIQISPAYNAQKGGQKKKKANQNANKLKKQQEEQNQREIKQNSDQVQIQHQYIQHLGGQMRQDQSSQIQADLPNLRNKKQTSYVSNVDGLDPQVYLKEHQRMI